MRTLLAAVATASAVLVFAASAFAAPPANDDFSGRATLPAASFFTTVTVSATNVEATGESGEPNHAGASLGSGCSNSTAPNTSCNRSAWFSWTASRTGTVMLNTCEASYDTTLAVYTGSAVGSLTEIASNNDAGGGCSGNADGSRVTFSATQGTQYQIAVAGNQAASGTFVLALLMNDDFAAAETPDGSGNAVGTFGTNRGATGEAGEPNHANAAWAPGCTSSIAPNIGCNTSVWYSWTPPISGTGHANTCDATETDFDTVLAVYTGNSVGGLTPLASNDDDATCDLPNQSKLTFNAVAGTPYKFAVSGKAGATGGFALTLSVVRSGSGGSNNTGNTNTTTTPTPTPAPIVSTPLVSLSQLDTAVSTEVREAAKEISKCGTQGLIEGCVDTVQAPAAVTYYYSLDFSGFEEFLRRFREKQAEKGAAARTVIARGTKKAPGAGKYKIKVKATKKGRRLLRLARRLGVRLKVTVKDAAGRKVTKTRKLTLKRKKRKKR